jgi:hypothetical protein
MENDSKDEGDEKEIYEFPNFTFYNTLEKTMDAVDNPLDGTNSTFYLPDGTKLSKNKIARILTSKFKAKSLRTRENRGFQINKKDIEKISRQYEIIDEINVLGELEKEDDEDNFELESVDKMVTQMTQMTHFKGAIPSSCQNTSVDERSDDDNGNTEEDGLTDIQDTVRNTAADNTLDGVINDSNNENISNIKDKDNVLDSSNHEYVNSNNQNDSLK